LIASVLVAETVPAVTFVILRVCDEEPTLTTFACPPSLLPAPRATEPLPVDCAAVPMAIELPPVAVVSVPPYKPATTPVEEPIAMLPLVCVPDDTLVAA